MADDSYGPFDSSTWTMAQWHRHASRWTPSGVYSTNDLRLTFNGLTAQLSTGRAAVMGAGYERANTSWTGVVTANANATLARIDRLVLRKDLAAQTVLPVLLQGTPATNPQAPALTQNEASTYDLPLWSFTVPPASSTVMTNVTDERPILPSPTQLSPAHWGTASSYPTSGARVGDTIVRSDYASLMRYNGSSWRQAEPSELTSPAARDAISPPHPGFQVIDVSTGALYRWNGAIWQSNGPTTAWTTVFQNASYDFGLANSGVVYDLPGTPLIIPQPYGRTVEVEFSTPVMLVQGGWISIRLVAPDGTTVDGATVSSGIISWAPGKLRGAYVGTGASGNWLVQAFWLDNSGAPAGSARISAYGAFAIPVSLRYRYI